MRSRLLRASGWTLVLTGLVLLGYVGWQLWGTTWVSERRHQEIIESVEQQWAAESGTASVSQGRVPAIVRIPRFGSEWAVPLVDGMDDTALAAGLGRNTEGAEPGARGNLGIAGHRITHGEPLSNMAALQPGDEVVVETVDAVHTYVLDTAGDGLTVDFSAAWVLDPRPVDPESGGITPSASRRLLTLVTCSELFHTDDRWVAFGHLVSSKAKG